MSTEYRRGIPSVAHVEAATRLGLEWQEGESPTWRWRFEIRNDELWLDFENPDGSRFTGIASLSSRRICQPDFVIRALWRPIRTDGTPVDWEVLDAEATKTAQPERRDFMAVRPDLHPHRWWRVFDDPRSRVYAKLVTTENAWRWGPASVFFPWNFE